MVQVKYGRLALFDIVTEISRIGLNIRIGSPEIRRELALCDPTSANFHFRPETHTRLTYSVPARASSVARENENPHSGLEAISPNSGNISQSYGSF
ncbi:hypothetical protein TNCV_3612921 [Trichonephila clavipes]|uniref:Uncharacterized protein n=1 Tax=Trichonephila clavipes TaxID=2585209 RepID=A0A8X6SWB4_TRICX|nr:hypothetical protein TNCV_3612921 [Trichonephila clavipes]